MTANPQVKDADRPKPRRIIMDRMPTFVEGHIRYLHIGETVSVRPIITLRHTQVSLSLMSREVGPEFDVRKITEAEEPDEAQQAVQELQEAREGNARYLSELILSWTLTAAMDGEALPEPNLNPDSFGELTNEEMAYLSFAVMKAVQSGTGELYDPYEKKDEDDEDEEKTVTPPEVAADAEARRD